MNKIDDIKISQFDLDGNWIKNWDSISDIVKEYQCSRRKIIDVTNGLKLSYLKYIWLKYQKEYQEGYNLFNIDINEAIYRPVEQINYHTKTVVHTYSSCMEAYKCISNHTGGINTWKNIYLCCQGKISSYLGYNWRFQSLNI